MMLPDVIKKAIVESAMKQREELREHMFMHRVYRLICDADVEANECTEVDVTFKRRSLFKEERDEEMSNSKEILEQLKNAELCGYNLEELMIFAEACRKAGIEQKDIHAFCENVESAFNYIHSKMLEELDRHDLEGEEECQ